MSSVVGRVKVTPPLPPGVVYRCEPGAEPGHVDVILPRAGWAKSAEPRRFWAKAPSGRTFVVYAHSAAVAVARLLGAVKNEFPWTAAWELYDTPLPEPARATGTLA